MIKTQEIAFVVLLWALSLGIVPTASGQKGKGRKPNIIYIYADDLGYGEIGPYGQKKIKTPNLDRMAAEGMRFTRHYTSSPVCAPARSMLLTGRHGGHSFIRGNYELGGFKDEEEGGQMPLPEGTKTIAGVLKEAGYQTAAVGKWGLGGPGSSGHPNRQGFDYFYGYLDQKQAHNYYPTHLWENGQKDELNNTFIEVHRKMDPASGDAGFDYYKGKDYSIDRMAEKAAGFIRKNKDQPFFLYLPLTIPHVSLQIPDKEVQQYVGQFKEEPYLGQKGYAATRYPLSTYAAMITYLDTQVGAIFELVKKMGLEDKTIILFSSDNGPAFNGGTDMGFFNSTGGLRGGKAEVYEGGLRVPFLARWPGKIPAGSSSGLMSAQFDMFATFCELAGIRAPKNDGISLLSEMRGLQQSVRREYMYFEFPEKGGQLAIRFEKYKAVKTGMKQDKNARWQLYDLVEDEKESNDIADKHPDLIRRLDAVVAKEHWPATVREWEFVDPKF